MIQSIARCVPRAKVICMAITNVTTLTATARGNYNARISAAVTAAANPKVVYLDASGVPTNATGGVGTTDGTHESISGYVEVYNLLMGSGLITTWADPATGGGSLKGSWIEG
jgi:hypothetical protein